MGDQCQHSRPDRVPGYGRPLQGIGGSSSSPAITRASFVSGTVDILHIAAVLLALGFLATARLVRGADLHQEMPAVQPVAAA